MALLGLPPPRGRTRCPGAYRHGLSAAGAAPGRRLAWPPLPSLAPLAPLAIVPLHPVHEAPAAAADDPQATRLLAAVQWTRQRVNGLTEETVRRLYSVYDQAGRELADQVRRLLEQYGGDTTWPLAAPLSPQLRARRLQALLVQIDAAMARLVTAAQDETLRAAVRTYRMSSFAQTWALDRALPVGVLVPLPLLPDEAVRAAVLYPYEGLDFFQRFESQRPQFVDRLRRAMGLSQAAGDTISQATSRLLRELGVPVGGPTPVAQRREQAAQALQIPLRTRGLTPRRHAELIARTELIRSSAVGALAVYDRNADVLNGWEWLSARDGRVEALCAALDGQVFALDSGQAPPPRHPRCRCAVAPRTKSFAELGLPGLERYEPKPRETYAQWAARRGVGEAEDGGLRGQRGRRLEREKVLPASELLVEEVPTAPRFTKVEYDSLVDKASALSTTRSDAYRAWDKADKRYIRTKKAADFRRAADLRLALDDITLQRRDAWEKVDKYPVRQFDTRSLAEIRAHIDLVPPSLALRLKAKGARVFIGKGTVTDFPENAFLRGMVPRGYPASITFDSVAGIGAGRNDPPIAYVGTDGGSMNVALHELGHVVDKLLGRQTQWASEDPEFVRLHDTVRQAPAGAVREYLLQAGAAGREETFASLFAQHLHPLQGPEAMVAGDALAPLRTWMADWVTRQSALSPEAPVVPQPPRQGQPREPLPVRIVPTAARRAGS